MNNNKSGGNNGFNLGNLNNLINDQTIMLVLVGVVIYLVMKNNGTKLDMCSI